MRKFMVTIAVGFLAVPVGVSGCSSKKKLADKVVSGQPGVKVNEDGSVEVRSEGGLAVAGSKKVPKDFPEGVPLPKGKIKETFSATTGGKRTWMVATEVDDIEKQSIALAKVLKGAGYSIDSELNQSSGDVATSMVVATKGKRTVLVQGESSDSKSPAISVIVSEE
jgi:hypothetical protein